MFCNTRSLIIAVAVSSEEGRRRFGIEVFGVMLVGRRKSGEWDIDVL
jgi:hypothetical protein